MKRRAEMAGAVVLDRKLDIRRHSQMSCGRACIGHSWIGCIFVVGRWRSGESIASLMYDYNLTRRQVKNAIAYIEKRRGLS